MRRVICATCKAGGKKSFVYGNPFTDGPNTVITTTRPSEYWDEDGVYHVHKNNWRKASYSCSNGHWWDVTNKTTCPAKGCPEGRLVTVGR